MPAPFSLTMAALCAALITLQARPAHAQGAPDLQRLERIQQEEQQRLQRQLEQERTPAQPPTRLQPDDTRRLPSRPDGPCRDVRTIVLKGAHSLLASTREKLVKPYEGRCLNVGDIERLMGDITAQYIDRGRITARVYLAAQDLTGGTLELTIVEGVLDEIRIEDGALGSISRANTFPGVVGKPLNLRDVEQGLDQINRLSSNNATMAIEPGAQPGESVLVVRNKRGKPWRASVSVDNHGSDTTGRNQLATSVSWDNPLGFNDFLSVSDRRTLDRHDGERDSQSNTLTYSVPFGWTLVTAGVSQSNYESTLPTAGGPLPTRGNSNQAYLRVDQAVWRDRVNLVTLSGTLTRKDTKSYFAGQLLDVASRTLSVMDLDLSLRRPAFGGLLMLGVGASGGLDWFGALKDPADLPSYAPRAQFRDKTRVNASWSRFFEVGARSVDVSTQFNGQYSRQALYGSEQILVGGIYSVRGFDKDTLSNDSGWMLRNEVGVRTPFTLQQTRGSWRAYAAVDVGRVMARPQGDFQSDGNDGDHGRLVGGALGVQLRWGPALLDTFVMKPLHRDAGLDTDRSSLRAVLSVAF